jgi:hypothetical protein
MTQGVPADVIQEISDDVMTDALTRKLPAPQVQTVWERRWCKLGGLLL